MADEPEENPEENPEAAAPAEPEIELPPPIPPAVASLSLALLSRCVSQVGKTFDGLSCAYTKLVAEEKELEEIGEDVKEFKNLRTVSLSKNLLKSVKEIKELPYLLALNASQNQIEAIDFCEEPDKLTYLQTVDLSQNAITELPEIRIINLVSLNLSANQIATAVNFNGHPLLAKLELRKNKLTDFRGINSLPHLQELYVAENDILSFEGLHDVPSLRTLHMRKNPVLPRRIIGGQDRGCARIAGPGIFEPEGHAGGDYGGHKSACGAAETEDAEFAGWVLCNR